VRQEIRRQIQEKYNTTLSSKRRISQGKLGQVSRADDWVYRKALGGPVK